MSKVANYGFIILTSVKAQDIKGKGVGIVMFHTIVFSLFSYTIILLAPCNFPMVAVGSHMGNHFNQPLDYILANTVREGSLLSQKHSHIHMALNKHT